MSYREIFCRFCIKYKNAIGSKLIKDESGHVIGTMCADCQDKVKTEQISG